MDPTPWELNGVQCRRAAHQTEIEYGLHGAILGLSNKQVKARGLFQEIHAAQEVLEVRV